MTFYFDYLSMEKFVKESDNLLFVGGPMTFLLKSLAGQLCTHAHGVGNVPLHTSRTTYATPHRDR